MFKLILEEEINKPKGMSLDTKIKHSKDSIRLAAVKDFKDQLTQDHINKLVYDSNEEVRSSLLNDSDVVDHTAPKVYDPYSKRYVRGYRRISANIQPHHLMTLARDSSNYVRFSVANHPKSDDKILNLLVDDPSDMVAKRALSRVSKIEPHIIDHAFNQNNEHKLFALAEGGHLQPHHVTKFLQTYNNPKSISHLLTNEKQPLNEDHLQTISEHLGLHDLASKFGHSPGSVRDWSSDQIHRMIDGITLDDHADNPTNSYINLLAELKNTKPSHILKIMAHPVIQRTKLYEKVQPRAVGTFPTSLTNRAMKKLAQMADEIK